MLYNVIITISLTKEDLYLVDEYCKGIGIPRSKFFVRSALKEVGVHKKDIDHVYKKPSKESPKKSPKKKMFSKIMGKYVDI